MSQKPMLIEESSTWPLQNLLASGEMIPGRTGSLPLLRDEVLALPSMPNYFHWLFEGLANFLLAHERMPELRIVVAEGRIPTFVKQSVALLSLDAAPASRLFKAQVGVLNDRGRDIGWVHPDEVSVLQRVGDRVPRVTSSSAIYVSRRNSSRSLPDEEAIENLMQSRGIRVIRAEELTFAEQIAVFRSASTVIAPHGAGLANLVFCDPGTKVRELMPLDRVNRCYQWLSAVARLEYEMLVYEGESVRSAADAAQRALTI